MANCPNCGTQFTVEDKHLGTLYTCSSCSAVFFVDWNGQPEMADHSESYTEPVESETVYQAPEVQDFIPPEVQDTNYYPPLEEVQSTVEEPTSDYSVNTYDYGSGDGYDSQVMPVQAVYGENIADSLSEKVPEYNAGTENSEYVEPSEIPSYGDSVSTDGDNFNSVSSFEQSDNVPYDFGQSVGEVPESHVESLDPSNLSDITEFANSNELTTGLTYSLVIEGIESFALIKELREAMTDSKFGWDTEEFLNSIQGGVLNIRRISPTKASILVGRLRYLPIRITWKQEILGG